MGVRGVGTSNHNPTYILESGDTLRQIILTFNYYNMETTIISLDSVKCLDIVSTGVKLPYKNTTEGSQNHLKHYYRFIYLGKVFNVHEDSPFILDMANDNVDSVKLEDTEDGLSFLSHVSISRADKAHFTKIKRSAYTVEFVQNSLIINPEEFA
jgi:hypothetical protein